MENDLRKEILDLSGFSEPYSLWNSMLVDSGLSTSVINAIFTNYSDIVSERIDFTHPLNSVFQAHQLGGIGFTCRIVDSVYNESEGLSLSLPTIDILGEDGRLIPLLNINFEEFVNLLNGTPEIVASMIQFLYINYRIMTGQASVYIENDGGIDFDDPTIWGMNNATATTLKCLGLDISRYSIHANNALSQEQRDFYYTLLDQARSVWDVPTDGPFVLN